MFRQSPVASPMTARRAARVDPPRAAPVDEGGSAQPAKVKPRTVPPIELGPIIKSKVQPPALRASTLTRQRLIDQLEEATSHRLTLLIAEAGYGKTTLLGDFARTTNARVVWYRLDSTDAEIVDWVSYLVAAFREVEPGFGHATVDLLGEIRTGGPPKSAFLASLISELGVLEARSTILVVDDFHVVEHIREAAELIGRLVRDAPPWLKVVVSTRRRPDLELGRLAAGGELAEITTDDLRFTRSETDDLFKSAFSMSLDDDVLATLEDRTMGWAASLQLFYGSIRGRARTDIRSIARALSGATSPVYDFLAEEVLGNVDPEIQHLLVRASLLENIGPTEVVALLADDGEAPNENTVRGWLEQADRHGLLSFSSGTSETRQLHPLLREFLLKELRRRESDQCIKQMHLRVARAIEGDDPLMAAHHYLEAGDQKRAMNSLDSSVVLTIGSGRWGMASQLISKLAGTPAGPAVAAIRARQLMEEGDLAAAAAVLDGVDVSTAPPDVRAQFRHTTFSLGWRTGERLMMFGALNEIKSDPDTPATLRDIADVLLDASPPGAPMQPLSSIGARLESMAANLASERLTFYSAVALHDSAVAFLNAGDFVRSLDAGSQALDRFSHLTFFAVEQLATHTAMALGECELGNRPDSEAHAFAALSTGRETADVPGELAGLAVLLGQTERATELIARARTLQRQNQTDAVADAVIECAAALSEFRTNMPGAIARLRAASFDGPFELGYSSLRDALLAQALLLDGNEVEALEITTTALERTHTHGAARAEGRLAVLKALLDRDVPSLLRAIVAAERLGALTLLELSDALLSRLELLTPLPDAVQRSIGEYPSRWLPAIRKLIESGNTPQARSAVVLLDRFGSLDDVGLLRAYAKTYVRKGPGRSLGRELARRTSPTLEVHDLGRTVLSIGSREVMTSAIRRKSASVLMYLITRAGFAANREQLVDALWPETDPDSASNNLNQSLYFLRREIDPWYEDDLSVDYVELQGDVVWLDRNLVRADSAEFLASAHRRPAGVNELAGLVLSYSGQFATEFEYDDWAMAWRGRIHATFLDLAHSITDELVALGDLRLAAEVAGHVIRVDPAAIENELRLVWIYGRMGRLSAARSQYEHLRRQDYLDGLDPVPLSELLTGPLP